ncbi:MAG: cation-translocating P-type ATPase [Bacteroidia bacterium]|nr:cation-translocating P-type ATPase [Bacteroidia bacterium]
MHLYQLPPAALLAEMESHPEGLSQAEAEERLKSVGPNEIQVQASINRFKLFISQFKSFLIYLLIGATVISFSTGEYADGGLILGILLLNGLIGYFQELSARRSIESLRKMNVPSARVFRGGTLVNLPARDLVPGDLISLEPGDKVSADARILKSARLRTEEAALTGESVLSEKRAGELTHEAGTADQFNMLFSSTTVVEGTAEALVLRTAMETEIGKITRLVRETEEMQTPLQEGLEQFGKYMGWIVLGICAVVALVMLGRDWMVHGIGMARVLQVFMVAVALAVAAVPEGLPAVVTLTLSLGVRKLLKSKALVRRLSAVETLGSCDVICSDKTGTLTRNEMTVVFAWTPESLAEISGLGYAPVGDITGEADSLLFEIGKYCNRASLYQEDGVWRIAGDPTEAAMLVSAAKAGIGDTMVRGEASLPFDADRKRMSVKVARAAEYMQFTKGAPGAILDICTHVRIAGEAKPLTETLRRQILGRANQWAEEALRVLAFAYRPLSDTEDLEERDLIFVGLQAMTDPLREDVAQAVETCKKAGIRVIMITGDHKATAEAIGAKLGISGRLLTGDDLAGMRDEVLTEALRDGANIFARTAPEHKQRIVIALQKMGHTVAMTGDGVNDAPALRQSDIGIALGSGTDVAKEAADLVLLEDSFATIVHTIEEGRGIYDNIQKSVMLLLSGNLAEVLIIFTAVLLGWSLPLTALMLLWINLITDGLPALALALDPFGKGTMERKPRPRNTSLLPANELALLLIMAVLVTAGSLFLYAMLADPLTEEAPAARAAVFTFLVAAEFVVLVGIRRYFQVKVWSNAWLWGAIALCLGLQMLVIYSPLAQVFEAGVPDVAMWKWLGISLGCLYVCVEVTALLLRRRSG